MTDSLFVGPNANLIARRVHKLESGILNRIKSILDDHQWLQASVLPLYQKLPVFTNLRAGTWYMDAQHECYFKSTDGHVGTWAFSSGRLNLSIAAAAANHGGAVLVDITKYGKRFPDSLARTVPIWACILNHVVFSDSSVLLPSIRDLLPSWIPASEASEITRRLPGLITAIPSPVKHAISSALKPVLSKPLVTKFICQPSVHHDDAEGEGDGIDLLLSGSSPPPPSSSSAAASTSAAAAPLDPSFASIICVSASRMVPDSGDVRSAHAGWSYVQGAGDDAETWAHGPNMAGHRPLLTPGMLWSHTAELLAARSDDECWAVIARIQAETAAAAVPAAELRPLNLTAILSAANRVQHSRVGIAALDLGCSVDAGGPTASAAAQLRLLVLVEPWSRATAEALHEATTEAEEPPRSVAEMLPRLSEFGHDCATVRLRLPVNKWSQSRFKDRWITDTFPALQAAIADLHAPEAAASETERIPLSVVVAYSEKSCLTCATVIAAACALILQQMCAPPGEMVIDKSSIRSAVSLAALASSAPSVDRIYVKELNQYFLSSG